MHTLGTCSGAKIPRWGALSLGLAFLLFAGSARAAMEIEGLDNATAPASNYDRYDNSSSWIGLPANWSAGPVATDPTAPYVWSGVGRDANNNTWGTMISPDFIVSANHFHPGVGDTLQFNYDNNASGPSLTRTVIGGQWLQAALPSDPGANGDVWIGELSPVTPTVASSVATYPILSLPFSSAFGGLTLSTFGLSADPVSVTSVRMGRNVIDAGSAQYVTGLNPANFAGVSNFYGYQFTYNNTPSNRGVGDDEAQVIPGDSGAPTFFLYAGATPALLGDHWLELTNNSGTAVGSEDTWLAPYAPDIQTVMNQLATQNVATNSNAVGETVKTVSPVLGDINLDGKLTNADVMAMILDMNSLANGQFQSLHGMNAAYFDAIADINGDGSVNAADIVALERLLAGQPIGGGMLSPVPEPAGLTLLLLGSAALGGIACRQQGSRHGGK